MELRVPRTSLITFVFLLLFSRLISARLPPRNLGSSILKPEEDIAELIGLEKCNDRDETCQQERMLAEAHLDYIYTQHHNKPKGSP